VRDEITRGHNARQAVDVVRRSATEGRPRTELLDRFLVASMHLWHVRLGHGDVWLYLYDDGRLISRSQSGNFAWVEQRLTPEAADRVNDEIISTGLFDPDRRPPGSQRPSGHNVQVRNGDRLVNLNRAEGQTWTGEFDRVAGRLATLQSWLPTTAWVQRDATLYLPARYAICTYVVGDGAEFNDPPQPREPADILPRLPDSVAALLATSSHTTLRDMTREIDPAAHERFATTLCFDVTSEHAARVAATVARVDWSPDQYRAVGHIVNDELPSSDGGLVLFVDHTPGVTIHVSFDPILPHGATGCPCGA